MSSEKQRLADAWRFPWLEIEVLIGGRSSIDLPSISVKDWNEATAFVCNYGYDPSTPADQRHMQAVFLESMNFIEKHLLHDEPQCFRPPLEVIDCEDIRHLVIWASGNGGATELVRAWSCALLRVIHTIAHIDGVHRKVNRELAWWQIRRRFELHLHKDEQKRIWLGGEKNRVELERIDWKDGKTRESMILKLLHKKGNVAETIYDLLGVRIVTKRLSDVMLAVRYLRKFYMITLANCVPGRCRNTLVDLEAFKEKVQGMVKDLEGDRITVDGFAEALEEAIQSSRAEGDGKSNPHSGSSYQSIQLTCRQLIRAHNPCYDWLEKLEEVAQQSKDGNLGRIIEYINVWPDVRKERDFGVFFPFEVQLMDKQAYEASLTGAGSHDSYRKSQLRAARRRVLGEVLRMV